MHSDWLIARKSGSGLIAAIVIASVASTALSHAQEKYPSRPVQLITPAAAGNSPDVVARIVADQLSKLRGEQVLVVNKAGGSGLLAANAAYSAPSDGYTLYASNTSSIVALPYLQKLPFDFEKSFKPIGMIGDQPMVIGVAPSLGVNTLGELIALAKKKPGEILFAATTRDSIPRFTMELLLQEAGVSMTYVFYSGTSQAMSDVLGGRLRVVVDGYSSLAGPIATGAIKPIAVTSVNRLSDRPDTPTVAETLPNFTVTAWYPLLAPVEVRDDIVQKVSRDLRMALQQPELLEKFSKIGTQARPMGIEETKAYIAAEILKWAPAIKKVSSSADK
jgi:tripartite-type tricarboxylate transporter receptor subunit TctC